MTAPVHTAIRLSDLPLFADDAKIGAALLGEQRACEWRELAPLYERRGLPKIDAVMGGRYVPAVRAFFDREYGVAGQLVAAPDGAENPEAWKTAGQQRRA
jgi:hypothetical protein